MSRTGMIAASVLVMVGGSVWALDDTPENRSKQADRYMAAIPPQEMFQDAVEQIAKNIGQEAGREFRDVMTKHGDIPALEKAIRECMSKHFTADELKALADFSGSPAGKSAMNKVGVCMNEVKSSIDVEMMKARAKAESKVGRRHREEMTEHAAGAYRG